MKEDMHNYPDVAPVGEDSLAKIARLAQGQRQAAQAVQTAEQNLEDAKERLRQISEVDLPEIMATVGMGEVKLADGTTVNVSDRIQARISAAHLAEAHKWLNENGHGNLIKREFKIAFGRDQEAWASSFEGTLDNEGVRYDRKQTVHPSTLKAFVRQSLEDGEDIPEDVFGVYRQTVAKLS